ncbi:MAG: hypothetical protein NWR54_03520, partial [Paracoccaceae bacterium]|nr:hypothetical protein [Paracoccaceae bacterium]
MIGCLRMTVLKKADIFPQPLGAVHAERKPTIIARDSLMASLPAAGNKRIVQAGMADRGWNTE